MVYQTSFKFVLDDPHAELLLGKGGSLKRGEIMRFLHFTSLRQKIVFFSSQELFLNKGGGAIML